MVRTAVREPKDIGFPFRDWGAEAIRLNLKTETRRLMHPQPPRGLTVGNISADGNVLEWILCDGHGDEVDRPCPKPSAWVGDRMFVKETYQEFCPMWGGAWCGHAFEQDMARDHLLVYRASNPDGALAWDGDVIRCAKWRQANLMPKRCARLFRDVVGVQAQRVRDITVPQAIAEGCPKSWVDRWVRHEGAPQDMVKLFSPIEWYHTAWVRINSRESWDQNHWVWAYTWAPGPPLPLLTPVDMVGW